MRGGLVVVARTVGAMGHAHVRTGTGSMGGGRLVGELGARGRLMGRCPIHCLIDRMPIQLIPGLLVADLREAQMQMHSVAAASSITLLKKYTTHELLAIVEVAEEGQIYQFEAQYCTTSSCIMYY